VFDRDIAVTALAGCGARRAHPVRVVAGGALLVRRSGGLCQHRLARVAVAAALHLLAAKGVGLVAAGALGVALGQGMRFFVTARAALDRGRGRRVPLMTGQA
jgi:hypothetical protein